MTDFKAKMHQIRCRFGLRPRPRWRSLQCSPRPPSWIWGHFAAGGGAGLGTRRERGGEGREGEVEGREREGPKLLLNLGPSEPSYATAYRVVVLTRRIKRGGMWRICNSSYLFRNYNVILLRR